MWLAFYKIDDYWELFGESKETRKELISSIKEWIIGDLDEDLSQDDIVGALEASDFKYIIVNEEDVISEIDLWNSG